MFWGTAALKRNYINAYQNLLQHFNINISDLLQRSQVLVALPELYLFRPDLNYFQMSGEM